MRTAGGCSGVWLRPTREEISHEFRRKNRIP